MSRSTRILVALATLFGLVVVFEAYADSFLPMTKKKAPVRIQCALQSGVSTTPVGPFSRDVALTDFVIAVTTTGGGIALRDNQNNILMQVQGALDSNIVINLQSPLVIKKGDSIHFTTNADGQVLITGITR